VRASAAVKGVARTASPDRAATMKLRFNIIIPPKLGDAFVIGAP
jgi:hypothetical protein